MRRIFTEDVGHFKKGTLKEWPMQTWNQLALNIGKPIDKFTKLEVVNLENSSETNSRNSDKQAYFSGGEH